jgi:polysaccharide biosynthesis transport protein
VPVLSAGYLNEAALGDLKTSMLRQETRIAQLQERYRDDAPELVDARASLESMKGLLRREVVQALKLAQAKVQGLRSRLETIDGQIAGLQADLAEMPNKEARLQDLDQRLTVLKARFLALTQDSDQARVTEQTSRRVSVVVLSPASAGRARNSHDYVRLALAPAFSLVVGIGLAFFIDGLDTRLRTARDVEDTTDLPVFASLTERKD